MKWKKVIAALLAFTLAFGVLPGTVFAVGDQDVASPMSAEEATELADAGLGVNAPIKLEPGNYKISDKEYGVPLVVGDGVTLTITGTLNTTATARYRNHFALTVTGGTVNIEAGAHVKGPSGKLLSQSGGSISIAVNSYFSEAPNADILAAAGESLGTQQEGEWQKIVTVNTHKKEFDAAFDAAYNELLDLEEKYLPLSDAGAEGVDEVLAAIYTAMDTLDQLLKEHGEDPTEEHITAIQTAIDPVETAKNAYENSLPRQKQLSVDEIEKHAKDKGLEKTDDSAYPAAVQTAITKINGWAAEDSDFVNEFKKIVENAKARIDELVELAANKKAAVDALDALVATFDGQYQSEITETLDAQKKVINDVAYGSDQYDKLGTTDVTDQHTAAVEAVLKKLINVIAKAVCEYDAEAEPEQPDLNTVQTYAKELVKYLKESAQMSKLTGKNSEMACAKIKATMELAKTAANAVDNGANKTSVDDYCGKGYANIVDKGTNQDFITFYLQTAQDNISTEKNKATALESYRGGQKEALKNVLKEYLKDKGLDEAGTDLFPAVLTKLNNVVSGENGIISRAEASINSAKSEDGVDSAYNQAVKDIQAEADLAIAKSDAIKGENGLNTYKETKVKDYKGSNTEVLNQKVAEIVSKYTGENSSILTASSTYQVESELARAKTEIDNAVEGQTAKDRIVAEADALYDSYGLKYTEFSGANGIIENYNGKTGGTLGSIDKAQSGPFDVFVSSAKRDLQFQVVDDARADRAKKLKDYIKKVIENEGDAFTYTLITWDADQSKYRPLNEKEYEEKLDSCFDIIANAPLTPGNEVAGNTAINAALTQAEAALASSSCKGYKLTLKVDGKEGEPAYYLPYTKVTIKWEGEPTGGKIKGWSENGKTFSPYEEFKIPMDRNHTFTAIQEGGDEPSNSHDLTFKAAKDPNGKLFITIGQQYVITGEESDNTVVEVGFIYASEKRMKPGDGEDLKTWLETNFNPATYQEGGPISKETCPNIAQFGSFDLKLNMQNQDTAMVYGCAYVQLKSGQYETCYFAVNYQSIVTPGEYPKTF